MDSNNIYWCISLKGRFGNRNSTSVQLREITDTTQNESRSEATNQADSKDGINNCTSDTAHKQNDELECLEIIERVANKFKTDKEFLDIMNHFIKIVDEKNIKKSNTSNILEVLLDLEDCKENTLRFIAEEFEGLHKKWVLKHLIVPKSDVDAHRKTIQDTYLFTMRQGKLNKNGKSRNVTIKTTEIKQMEKFFLNEATVLSKLIHQNIIQLLAVVNPCNHILFEHVRFCLTDALKTMNFTPLNCVTILEDIVTGMEYMHEKEYLHRNLWIQHIFICNNRNVKIGGFEHSVYVGDSNGEYCAKEEEFFEYTCPEAYYTNIFNSKTDVWSVGIFVWCLYYFQNSPYFSLLDVTYKNSIIQFRDNPNVRLIRPQTCPEKLYNYTVSNMLSRDSRKRETMTSIKLWLKEFIKNKEY